MRVSDTLFPVEQRSMRSSALEDPVEMQQGWTSRQDRELRGQKIDADFYQFNEPIIFFEHAELPWPLKSKSFPEKSVL